MHSDMYNIPRVFFHPVIGLFVSGHCLIKASYCLPAVMGAVIGKHVQVFPKVVDIGACFEGIVSHANFISCFLCRRGKDWLRLTPGILIPSLNVIPNPIQNRVIQVIVLVAEPLKMQLTQGFSMVLPYKSVLVSFRGNKKIAI